MHHLSRRNWLKSSALASLAIPFTGMAAVPKNRSPNPFFHDTQLIRLNANENPYGPSEKAKLAIIESLSLGNRYQIDLREQLKAAIAKKEGLSPENVMLGAGSSEILGIVGVWAGAEKKTILSADRTFPIMMNLAENMGVNWQKTPLDKAHRFDLAAIKKAIRKDTGLVYICNPNNPTSTMLKKEELSNFCQSVSKSHPVFVDEAYIEYTPSGTQNSMAYLIKDNPNIFVARTFSKLYGLAGMRIGYALGHVDRISELKKYHSGYEISISSSGLSAALASLGDDDFLDFSLKKNEETKQLFYKKLKTWDVPYADSVTSFVYFPVDKFISKGQDFGQAFFDHQINCRPFPKEAPKWCRMTMGTTAEMEKALTVLEQLIS